MAQPIKKRVSSLSKRERYRAVRAQSIGLCATLSDADATAQSMPDASPAKWHLAHTSWFFEEFMLAPIYGDTVRYHERFSFLFNSYYDAVGARHERPKRGLLTRPSLDEILAYRRHVDDNMVKLLADQPDATELLDLGLAHEQQHQELLLTDILHLFAQNPMQPALKSDVNLQTANLEAADQSWDQFDGVLTEIGHDGPNFAFDCETPQHPVVIRPFEMASRAVTNREWLAFIEDGGYQTPAHWLSDGFATAQQNAWQAPLYWTRQDDCWHTMTLSGPQRVNLEAPVTHISFYEADALCDLGRCASADRTGMGNRCTGSRDRWHICGGGLFPTASPDGSRTDAIISAMSGNGPPARSHLIPVTHPQRAQSASIMANS